MDENEAKDVRELVKAYEERVAIFSGAFNMMVLSLEVVLDHGEMSDPVRTCLDTTCRAAREIAKSLDPDYFEKGIQDLLRDQPE